MATTTRPTRSRTAKTGADASDTRGHATATARRGPRVRGSGGGRDGAAESHDKQYDLLTAALLGAALGAGTTLLLRQGPSGRRPISPAWRVARAGARLAGRGARVAFERGADAWERLPREEIGERVRDYFETARDTIDHAVESELQDLRKAIRRRRRKLGL